MNAKIMLVFGTRPEAIKMAPVIRRLKTHKNFDIQIAVTGQHRHMLDQVLDIFDIKPDFDLDIMSPKQDLTDVTTKVLLGMRHVLAAEKPDMVLVHGDTTSSMAAALAAFYSQIPVGHVEAGLRTWNVATPWPEEMNRQLTGRIATLHFAPTQANKENLLRENVASERIFVTGNTVIDALQIVVGAFEADSALRADTDRRLAECGYDPRTITDEGRKMVLITGHRRENFGIGFRDICNALSDLAQKYPEVDFVYPMHLNPNVRKPIHDILGEKHSKHRNIHLVEPLDYLAFVRMMSLAHIILTDSGGIQEEAPGLGKPVLVMRDTTERPEAVEAGTALLVGTDRRRIVESVADLIENADRYSTMSEAVNPYGNGDASAIIGRCLENFFNETRK